MKTKLLIIDEDHSTWTALSNALDEYCTIVAMSSAKDALKLFSGGGEFSVILLELILPGMSGMEFLEIIRNDKNYRPIHVIILTSSQSADWAAKCANFNVQGYFQKPLALKPLKEKIMSLNQGTAPIEYVVLKNMWGADYLKKKQEISFSIRQALDHIEVNYHTNCGRVSLSEFLHISSDHLSRRFQSECGIRLTEYITMLRIYHSKEMLLRKPHLKLKELANAVGIYDVDYFCKVFKKHTGLTPSEYRSSCSVIASMYPGILISGR